MFSFLLFLFLDELTEHFLKLAYYHVHMLQNIKCAIKLQYMKYWYSMIDLCINVTLLRKCLQTIP